MGEKETYRIQYVDNTYQLVDWDINHIALVYKDMSEGKPVTMVDKCIFKVADIRAIFHLEKLPEDEKMDEEKEEAEHKDEETMVITEMGAYEKELYELMISQGIELGDKLGERRKTK